MRSRNHRTDTLIRKLIPVLTGTVFMTACVALITPDLETTLTELKKGQYSIDITHSSIHFKVDHFGFTKQVGRFNRFDASLDFNPENLTAAKLRAVVSTASIDFNNDSLEDTIRGGSWLNTDAFPEATYETLSAEQLDESTVRFSGELTLLGETRPLSLDITFNGGANNFLSGKYTIGFSAVGTLRRSDFGMDSFIPAVGDEVFLDINAEFQQNE